MTEFVFIPEEEYNDLVPREIFIHQRATSVLEAIDNSIIRGSYVPLDWIEELYDLVNFLNERT